MRGEWYYHLDDLWYEARVACNIAARATSPDRFRSPENYCAVPAAFGDWSPSARAARFYRAATASLALYLEAP